uniref:Protein-associating with the carboxyl-terminal domain of ezrin n=1 Tax=Ascaris suum TaxID=6253 RepID=F1KVM3_ASCSU
MGSSESALRKDIEIGEEVPRTAAVYRIWSDVFPCVEGKRWRRTLFVRRFAKTDSNETRCFFENGIKRLRQLRHPYIVEYVASSVGVDELSLLTERVNMLDLTVESLLPIEVHTGLAHILSALIFLHEKAALSHNNVSPSSVFVSLDGRWKLSGFECAQELHNTHHWVQSDFVRSVKDSMFSPPEDELMLKTDIPPTARDAFAFGKLIAYAMPYIQPYLPAETIGALEEISRCLTNADATKRGELASVANSHEVAFKNILLVIVDFLQTVHLKTREEKAHFFRNIIDWLREIPQVVIGRRLISLLLSRYVLLEQEAHSTLIPFVVRPSDLENNEPVQGLLPLGEYRRWIVPELLRIFHVHEISVRIALLAHFMLYIPFFMRSQIENEVLPELLLGMRDADDRVVCASLHAMAHLVPLLGGPAVTGLIHAKSFADGAPKKAGIYSLTNDRSPQISSPIDVSLRGYEMTAERKNEPQSSSSYLSRMLSEEDLADDCNVRLRLMSQTDGIHNELEQSHSIAESRELQGNDWCVDWDENEKEASPVFSSSRHEVLTPLSGTSSIASYEADINCRKPKFEIGMNYDMPSMNKSVAKGVDVVNYFADMEPVFAKAPSLIERLECQIAAKVKEANRIARSRFAALSEDEGLSEGVDLGAWEAEVADWDAD